MNSDIIWFFLSKDPQTLLAPLKLQINSQIYAFQEDSSEIINFQEVYRVSDSWPILVKPIGLWGLYQGLVMSQVNIWERRKNLEGTKFLCSTESDPPFLYSFPTSTDEVTISGIVGEIWSELEKKMNFS
jgi:hypothetical protein